MGLAVHKVLCYVFRIKHERVFSGKLIDFTCLLMLTVDLLQYTPFIYATLRVLGAHTYGLTEVYYL